MEYKDCYYFKKYFTIQIKNKRISQIKKLSQSDEELPGEFLSLSNYDLEVK